MAWQWRLCRMWNLEQQCHWGQNLWLFRILALWKKFEEETHSDSCVATGHLYCAVLNRQISANCRTVKTMENIRENWEDHWIFAHEKDSWHTWNFHFLHYLVGIIGHVNIDTDWLSMVINLRNREIVPVNILIKQSVLLYSHWILDFDIPDELVDQQNLYGLLSM